MKKLMLVLGVAVMAVGVQAASFNWSTGSTKAWGIGTADLTAGLAAGQTYTAGGSTKKNADTMSNQLTSHSATWAYILTLTDASDPTKTDTLSGSLTSASFNSRALNLNLSSDLVTAGKDLNYSIVFTGTITDANSKTWDVTSDTISGSWHVNDMGDIALSTAPASSWSTAAVPEPTSGLLMLVGLGALALRRRRA